MMIFVDIFSVVLLDSFILYSPVQLLPLVSSSECSGSFALE